ncbi:unnamed protein product, partial [Ectocarpus sp. 12 AP-2014]
MRTQGNHELGANFFDYRDDKQAFIQEDEVAQALTGRGCMFEDPAFPASGDSLYRTPQQPPAGTLPAALVVWGRISQQEVRRCHSPVTFPLDEGLAAVVQGALGDSWLVSALNMLAPFPEVLKKVVVSDRHSDKGVYTLKLFKEGAWRYIHVDDRLPCSPSRTQHYCCSKNPNQARQPPTRSSFADVWAPLIEKAFAKLHGCYESLGRGSIEQGLRCLTGTPLIRTPLTGLEPKSDLDGGVADKESEKRRQDLWAKMKKWHGRGCVMGCYRGVEFDRARNRQAASYSSSMGPFGGDNREGPGRRQTGLMAGRGYCIESVCQASAGATQTRDAAMFQLVELSCPWGVGQWRGDWSRNSGMWDAYPSIKAELRRLRQQRAGLAAPPPAAEKDGEGGGGAGALGAVTEATAVGAGRAAREQEEQEQEQEGSSFWMTFDDFTNEFSQMLTCVSYSAGQESKGLSRKSYRGVWIPGDSLTGSGGGCASPSFLQNPFYPVTIQRNSTTMTVCLSIWDRAWQVDPAGRGPAIGYYIVRLTGSKPRLTKLRPNKIAARSMAFVAGTQSAGEHTFDSG